MTINLNDGFAAIRGSRSIASSGTWVLLDASDRQLVVGLVNSVGPLNITVPLNGLSSGVYVVSLIGEEYHADFKIVWMN